MYSAYDINPVEELFKSIKLLQSYDECAVEVDLLVKKLVGYITTEKNGIRVYGKDIKYYPNGLCTRIRGTGSNINRADILLPEWEPQTETPEPVKEKSNDMKRMLTKLTEFNLLWGLQIKEHLGLKYIVTKDRKIEVAKLVAKYEEFDKVIQETGNPIPEIVMKNFIKRIDTITHRFIYFLRNNANMYGYNSNSDFCYLKKEYRDLISVLVQTETDTYYLHSKLADIFKGIKRNPPITFDKIEITVHDTQRN